MDFVDIGEKASCPYNPNHIFDKQKLMFHINRCKDKQKVAHLFKSCKYNPIHIIRIEDFETHEMICEDRADVRQLTTQLRQSFLSIQRQRERSRQKLKLQKEETKDIKQQIKIQNPEDVDFDSCGLCQKLQHQLQKIKKIVGANTLQKIAKAQKLIKLHSQLDKYLNKKKQK